jgi:hypothetical protein
VRLPSPIAARFLKCDREFLSADIMKALVLGATGHIGNAIVRELLKRGYDVTAAYRRSGPPT